MNFTRLEIKDILHNLGPGIDPDVLEKLRAGAASVGVAVYEPPRTTVPLRQRGSSLPPGNHDATLEALTAPGVRAELTPRLEAAGWTQEDIDRVNADADNGIKLNAKLDAIVPIVGEENASNIAAAFAGPDLPAAPPPPPPLFAIGAKNQYGDICRAHDINGTPAFQCKDCGKGYIYNRNVGGGCPFCFINGGGSTTARDEDEDAVEGAESDW